MKQTVDNLKSFAKPESKPSSLKMTNSRLNSYNNINIFSKNTTNITYNLHNNQETKFIEQPKGESIDLIETHLNEVLKEKNKEKEEMPVGKTITAVNFYWDNAKFTSQDTFNFKGKVEHLSSRPFPTTFENERDKKYMTEESHFDKPWQELVYVVDLEASELKGSYSYKILKVHENQTFYPDEE